MPSRAAERRPRLAPVGIDSGADRVVLLMPGPGGPGRVPAAPGWAVALRVKPLSMTQRLGPVGLPSLTQHGRADGIRSHRGGTGR